MVRKAMREPAVREATALPHSTLWQKVKDKKFPAPTKLDPNGRAVVWWEDEIIQYQSGTWKAPAETEAA